MATLAEVEGRVRDLELRVRGTEQAQTENLALKQADRVNELMKQLKRRH